MQINWSFFLGKERGLPLSGTPTNDPLGDVDSVDAFAEFDARHNEVRVFQATLSYLNDPFNSLDKRSNLEEWLKGFGEADPKFPWVVEYPDSQEIIDMKMSLDETISQAEVDLDIPFSKTSLGQAFERILSGLDWKQIQ